MQNRTLISSAELAALQREGEVLVVDCRFELGDTGKGERDYLAGHVPGAVYAHLDRDLSGAHQVGLGRHPLPEDVALSAVLSRWGWRPGLPVVAYDAMQGALAAARLWWLLRLAGETQVAVLDGGLQAWQAAGHGLEAGGVQRAPSDVQVALERSQVVWTGELEQRLRNHALCLLDARAAPRYRGEVEPLDPVAGHVPGALNLPFADNLAADGRFKSASELRAAYERRLAGHAPGDVVHMCGSGVTACHNLLAMEHAGLTGSRVFAPSWSGWVDGPGHAVATGSSG
ncbi:sulfurtransferase [Dokdonella sp.]|uniref:sulfurtransferase n=1 Tax=Dokdonella sp. TaxID=2291710 RepID=UPI0031C03870|nr:sulfurtransferase [Dokdonella sp.]